MESAIRKGQVVSPQDVGKRHFRHINLIVIGVLLSHIWHPSPMHNAWQRSEDYSASSLCRSWKLAHFWSRRRMLLEVWSSASWYSAVKEHQPMGDAAQYIELSRTDILWGNRFRVPDYSKTQRGWQSEWLDPVNEIKRSPGRLAYVIPFLLVQNVAFDWLIQMKFWDQLRNELQVSSQHHFVPM